MAKRDRRWELNSKLKDICPNVYFQPPSNKTIKYPCIIYHEDVGRGINADNLNYLYTDGYSVTVIDKDPDSELPDMLMRAFPMIRRSGPYRADNLNHYPFTLYY